MKFSAGAFFFWELIPFLPLAVGVDRIILHSIVNRNLKPRQASFFVALAKSINHFLAGRQGSQAH